MTKLENFFRNYLKANQDDIFDLMNEEDSEFTGKDFGFAKTLLESDFELTVEPEKIVIPKRPSQICDYCMRIIYSFHDILETEKADGTKVYRHADTNFPCSKIRKLKAEVTKQFRGGSVFPTPYTVTLPADLRCVAIDRGATQGSFFLDEFPRSIFPANSCITHDATTYGITISPDEVY